MCVCVFCALVCVCVGKKSVGGWHECSNSEVNSWGGLVKITPGLLVPFQPPFGGEFEDVTKALLELSHLRHVSQSWHGGAETARARMPLCFCLTLPQHAILPFCQVRLRARLPPVTVHSTCCLPAFVPPRSHFTDPVNAGSTVQCFLHATVPSARQFYEGVRVVAGLLPPAFHPSAILGPGQ